MRRKIPIALLEYIYTYLCIRIPYFIYCEIALKKTSSLKLKGEEINYKVRLVRASFVFKLSSEKDKKSQTQFGERGKLQTQIGEGEKLQTQIGDRKKSQTQIGDREKLKQLWETIQISIPDERNKNKKTEKIVSVSLVRD